MTAETLYWLRENARHDVAEYLVAIGDGDLGNGTPFVEVAVRYRLLAIAALLADLDLDTFRRDLLRSAYADLALRSAAESDPGPFEPYYLRASQSLPFSCALAAGSLSLARDLASKMPMSCLPSEEYADDFLRYRFQHLLALEATDSELQSVLDDWSDAASGDVDSWYSLALAILTSDQAAFDIAIRSLSVQLEQEQGAYCKRLDAQPEITATDGRVSIQGLGMLRLAECRGLDTAAEYALLPRESRLTLISTLVDPSEWRST